jgi:pyrimidine oxygenase
MIITAPTDEEAEAKWTKYVEGIDMEALAWVTSQTASDKQKDARSTAARLTTNQEKNSLVNMNGGVLIGSYEKVAEMLDEVADVEGVKGVMLTFDDFLWGIDVFGKEIQPKMKSRSNIQVPVIQEAKKEVRKRPYDGNEEANGAHKVPRQD